MRRRQNAEKRVEKDHDKDSEMNASDAEDQHSIPEDSDAKIGSIAFIHLTTAIIAFITHISEVPCTASQTGFFPVLGFFTFKT